MADHNRDQWDEMVHTFEIRQARIVAIFGREGGAIVEQVRRVTCREGRIYREDTGQSGTVQALEYEFAFSSAATLEPTLRKAAQARIIISGRHANGHWLEVRGSGVIGYHLQGHVEGLLDPLPTILTERAATNLAADLDQDDVADSVGGEEHLLPPQFLQAIRTAPGGSARRQALRAAQAQAVAEAKARARLKRR